MADINKIAKDFADLYYKTFDTDRSQLGGLYREHSMLTFEGKQFLGGEAIVKTLTEDLKFDKVQHNPITVDAQPSSLSIASLLVSVTGQLVVDDGTNILQYSQVFQLIPENGMYYVFNDIFRLNYG